MSATRRERHCDSCTCGLTAVQWSDREGFVDLADPEDIADTVMSCALDHSYDRTGGGIPYGIPADIAKLLAPIVAKHLALVEPDWENKTVYMHEDGQREAFKSELVAALKESAAPSAPQGGTE